MKKMKIAIVATLCLSFMVFNVSSYGGNISDGETPPTNDIINDYLLDAGYPADVITLLDDNTKLKFFDGKYRYESSETTYGIFTESNQIEYQLGKNEEVIVNDENLNELNSFLKDDSKIAEIMQNNEKSKQASKSTVLSAISPRLSIPTATDSLSKTAMNNYLEKGRIENELFMENNVEKIRSIQAQPAKAALRSLSNWQATILCSHISYSGGTARKSLVYIWNWNSMPFWTLTDKVGMAWSGGFTSEPTSVEWSYTAYGESYGLYDEKTWSGKGNNGGYDEYDPGAGVGKDINIVGSINGIYTTYEHSGAISTELTKITSENSRESAVGRYYHKNVALASGSLSFSKSGPSIGLTFSANYDKSADSAVAFNTTTK